MGVGQRATAWHALEGAEVLDALGVGAEGLDEAAAAERLRRYGPNRLPEPPRVPGWRQFLAQFQDVLVLVLVGATGVSAALGEFGDAVTIAAIVVMNAILGYLQESRAERALASLRALSAPMARVVRGGRRRRVPAEELVPGDLVEVEAGDRLPADIRLLRASGLEVEESALTGESTPVAKHAGALAGAHLGPADQANMAFMGTVATRGRGEGVVVATGLATQVGQIAGMLAEAQPEPTPLERRLAGMGRALVAVVLGVCAAVVAVAAWRGEPLYRMLLTGVSLGVAAIPEGLPAIVTVALALGVQRMARRNAIVRRLPAVEALGCATVVGTDKTGTLTRNEMAVRAVWVGGRGEAFAPWGGGDAGDPWRAEVRRLVTAAAACCDAAAVRGRAGEGARPEVDGEPTEAALVTAALGLGASAREVGGALKRLGELPFDSEVRRMAVLLPEGALARSVVKGAPDAVVPLCRRIRRPDGSVAPMDGAAQAEVRRAAEEMASGALRVLAVAERSGLRPSTPPSRWQEDLVFLGLVGLMDPPRPEARGAVARCLAAGVRVVMITGDHPRTAEAVAREVGLNPEGGVITGADMEAWDDAELVRRAAGVRVLARATPRHKLRLVRALKARGEIVAMTGDGVNDAPAVREADVGVAMGRTGTDVTREAAAVVLADDNFATIAAAIEEGRAIYDNVRRFVRYLLACNTGEVLTMFLAALAGAPMPLVPLQILWVNLVTDGLPALALGLEPADPDAMRRPPRPPRESIFARRLGARIAGRGTVIAVVTLAVFLAGLRTGHGLAYARTLAFAALTMQQLVYVFECRTESGSPWRRPLSANPWVPLAVLSSLALFALTLYVPALRPLFATVPLRAPGWLAVAAASLAPALLGW
ncbi:MAG: cation-translocating P-type ATPase [Firmicutes bacterium]|nr:cation-translocating P-type ATPase [Bacillota bacterium]